MSVINDLLRNNAGYSASFDKGGLEAAPALKLAVLTCMDARIDISKVLGLEEGQAHVIRNAGGLPTEDAIRSLIISHRVLGTEELLVIHHTKCGMHTLDSAELKSKIAKETGEEPPFDLGAIPDLDLGVKDAVRDLVDCPYINYRTVRGFVYDVTTGALREVQL